MKRVLIGIVSTIAILLLAVVLYLAFADLSKFQPNIEEAIAGATGRELRINGEFVLEVFPPTVVAEDVTFENAEWAPNEPMMSAGHMSVKVDGSSLLFGPLTIDELRLSDVRVVLEENAEGEANWVLGTDAEPEEADDEVQDDGDEDVRLILSFAELKNIEVVRRKPDAEDQVISLALLDVATTEERMITAEGNGTVYEQPVTLSANVGPIDNIRSGRNIGILLNTDFGLFEASVEGDTGNPDASQDAVFDIRLTSDDISGAIELLELPIDLAGEFQAESNISTGNGQHEVTFDIQAVDLGSNGSVTVDGNRLTIGAEVTSLPRLGEIGGMSGLPEGPASFSGDLVVDGANIDLIDFSVNTSFADFTTTLTAVVEDDLINVDPFSISLAESDLSGAVSVQTAEPLTVRGEIQSTLLDLTVLNQEEEGEAEAAEEEPEEATEGFVLNEDPLPFDLLATGIIDLSLGIDDFRNGAFRLQQVQTAVQLENGVLRQDVSFAVPDGGNAKANLELAATGDSAALDIHLEVADLRLRLGQAGQRTAEEIPAMQINADIQSTGNSLHMLAASANGKMVMTQGPGKVSNTALGKISGDIVAELFSALNPFAKEEPYSNWECTVVGFNIVDGVGTLDPVLAQGEKVTIVADGTVDFNDESLDIGFNTKPRKGVGITADMFVTPFVKLAGTLGSPHVGLDTAGVLLEGGAAVLTGGMSFLIKGAADRASGGQDRCAAALAMANGEAIEAEE